jgi:hypothetical protein
MVPRTLVAVLLATPLSAFAQQTQQDQEYQQAEVDSKVGKVKTRIGFESEVHSYNNIDFRPLDESNDQAILDSDDRGQFAFTGISTAVVYAPTPDLAVNIGASHRGMWGNDQTGSVNRFGGFVYFTNLSLDWKPGATDADPDGGIFIRIGRQFYELGGIGGSPDFVLSDVVDGVRVDIPVGEVGRFNLLPYSVVSSAGDNANANFVSFIGQSRLDTFGFRGDTVTQRFGGQFILDGAIPNLDARVHAFYTDIGAMGTGADISYDGDLGNFADNDWVANFGLRASYEAGPITAWGEFAGSAGVDRKELVAQDVSCSGMAYGAGARLETEGGIQATVSYFDAWGASYTSDGMQYSHGYVSMKGRQAGGLIANRYMGWHPTAYVGTFGIDDTPHDQDRKTGTRVIHGGAGIDKEHFAVDIGAWMFQDTGVSALNVDELDTITPPYGYSRAEFAAQERLGRGLGQEVDLTLTYRANKYLSFYGDSGVLLPGSFYAILIDRSAGDQLGGQTMAWAANVGTRLEFR